MPTAHHLVANVVGVRSDVEMRDINAERRVAGMPNLLLRCELSTVMEFPYNAMDASDAVLDLDHPVPVSILGASPDQAVALWRDLRGDPLGGGGGWAGSLLVLDAPAFPASSPSVWSNIVIVRGDKVAAPTSPHKLRLPCPSPF